MRHALVVLILLVACKPPVAKPVTPTTDGDFAATIPDAATWTALAQRAGNEVMARVEVVKVMLDRDENKLYFMQSRKWQIHFEFAQHFLMVMDHARFNEHEYHADDRRFILGTITHYLDGDSWTFELFSGDTLKLQPTVDLFATLKRVTYFGDKLRYRVIPEAQLAILDQVRAVLPAVTTEELFANVKYEPIEPGDAYGYLRIVAPNAPLPNDLHPYDIVVLGTQPLELSPVAGIVTDELQAPLGHLAILAHSRHTPNMALRGASSDPAFAALAGKPVHLRVGPADYVIEAATSEQLAAASAARRGKAPALSLALNDPGLLKLADIDPDDIGHFGAKTVQLAKVAALEGIVTPRAFGLGFFAYHQFLVANKLDKMIAAIVANHKDDAKLRADLAALRGAIDVAPIPATIVDPLLAQIGKVLPGSAKVRLRSSTNSEDLAGFSGAGLYRSTRVDPTSRADVERGLREVWGSVWSYDAFAEREWYGIDHARVAMAILVQESIDDDVVNGVAITGNPYFQGRPGVYVNAQVRGGSVTGATGDELPEQFIVYTYNTARGVERISQSSRAKGRLFSDPEAMDFMRKLEAIHFEFTGEQVGTAAAVDVEFIIRANRQLVIVQARPYKMVWTEGRLRGD